MPQATFSEPNHYSGRNRSTRCIRSMTSGSANKHPGLTNGEIIFGRIPSRLNGQTDRRLAVAIPRSAYHLAVIK